jgi:hypothetical protein
MQLGQLKPSKKIKLSRNEKLCKNYHYIIKEGTVEMELSKKEPLKEYQLDGWCL